jgi:ATP-dependent DNA helicase RecG
LIHLDRIAKKLPISDKIIKELKAKKLIEGRKPNLYISATVAKATNQTSDYIKIRGIDDNFIQKMIIDYLKKFKTAKRVDFENILLDKLPDILDINQKKNKIKNNLQALKKAGKIENKGKVWQMSKS